MPARTERTRPPADLDPRWPAFAARDRAADGSFFVCVHTTGVYCRPSCPARRPKPENVSFAQTPDEAEAQGFRACKRCRPREAGLDESRARIVADACRAIESADEPPRLDALAARAGLSRFHFHRLFRQATGLTPKAYADAERARRARAELSDKDSTVTSAIYGSGFNSNGRFYAAADGMFGMTPGAFKAGGAGQTIRYAFGDSSLGQVLVASTGRGVCFVALENDGEDLVAALRARFSAATITRGDDDYAAVVAAVVAAIDDPAKPFDLPLDIQGTAFQQRVWRALRDIPAGQTRTYGELAAAIGAPKASRAVGAACGANKIAVVIPCHRALGANGSLTGFRWGVKRKKALLAKETGE